MKFSVIIPIYNVESYLDDCIKSVINQDVNKKMYEIILVNDGSTDSSASICSKYEKKYSNIKIINKANGGLSDARNVGIDNSSSEYILFLDGDDTLVENTLSICNKLIIDQDMIIGNQNRLFMGIKEKKDFPASVFNYQENLQRHLSVFVKDFGLIPWASYQSVYKASLIKENGIYFKKGLVGAEDCDFFFKFIKFVDNYSITNHSFVNYLMTRPDSIMNNVKIESLVGRLETFSKIFLETENEESNLKNFFSFKFCNAILDISKLHSKNDRDLCLEIIKRNKLIIMHAQKASVLYKIIYFFLGNIWFF